MAMCSGIFPHLNILEKNLSSHENLYSSLTQDILSVGPFKFSLSEVNQAN